MPTDNGAYAHAQLALIGGNSSIPSCRTQGWLRVRGLVCPAERVVPVVKHAAGGV